MPERTAISILGQQLNANGTARTGPIPHPFSVEAPGTDERAPVRSLYVHVPFCFHKCHYCDFYSIVDTRDRQAAFLDRLERELAAMAPLSRRAPLRTIFVGGGTPSLLRVDLWERLLATLNRLFDLRDIRAGEGEFTVECNPETVSPELMATLRKGGVDRVSIGAQSFNPQHLKTLERWHEPANVRRAVQLASDAGIVRQSVDLIFGIPGQTLAEWHRDLEIAIGLGTEHISCYNLTYEANTAMTARLKRGEFVPADEDLEVDMYEATLSTLRAAGLDRYEISNYARPGAEAKHNLAYWRQEQWFAAGPSASGHIGGYRWKNSPRLDDYLSMDDHGWARVVDLETPDPRRALAERLMTGCRLREGLPSGEAIARAATLDPAAAARLAKVWDSFASEGLIRSDSGERWCLNDAGMLVADSLAGRLMDALDPR